MILKKHIQEKKTIIGILISITLIIFLPILLKLLLRFMNITDATIFILSIFYYWLSLILIYLYSVKIEKQSLLIWQEKKYSFSFYIKSIILVFILSFTIFIFVAIVLGFYEINIENNKSEELIQILKGNKYLIFFVSITAGITEELISRGYFLTRLQLIFKGKFLPILLSALFFGITHIGYESLTKIIVTTFIGLIFGMHYYKYRNIKILIFIHFIWDFIILGIITK